jgi:hypothetical protein
MFGRGDDERDDERGPLLGCAALGVGAVVVLLVLLAVVASCSPDDDGRPRKAAPSSSAPVPATVTVTATSPGGPPSAPASAPTSSPAARPARVAWSGPIALTDGDGPARDLDATPPRTLTAAQGGDIQGTWFNPGITGLSGTKVATVEARTRPGARECREAVETAGTRRTDTLEDGDVVCVLTSAGRVGRLVVTAARSRAGQATVTLHATLWDGG